MKVYGPYSDEKNDGRQHVVIINDDDKSRRTVSYPKYLMEQKLGRRLDPDLETVDHKDGNFLNNAFDNLQLLTRVENAVTGKNAPAEMLTFNCIGCGVETTRRAELVRKNLKLGKKGPYCTRECGGAHSRFKKNHQPLYHGKA